MLESGIVDHVSLAARMSWASNRQTTRLEDMSYCLLGIFDVNMPLLYGEGDRAFFRLQKAIMESSEDQSLFAWGLPLQLQIKADLFNSISDYPERSKLRWLVANSPADFSLGHKIEAVQDLCYDTPIGFLGSGVQINAPVFRRGSVLIVE